MYYISMLGIKKFSWVSFGVGAVAGIILGAGSLALFVNYLFSNAIYYDDASGKFLGTSINQVHDGLMKVSEEKKATSVYGKVISVGGGTIVIEVSQVEGPKQYTFIYDDSTRIVSLAHDAASTEVPYSSDEIQAGDRLTVTTNEAVGSVSNQHAVKIIKL